MPPPWIRRGDRGAVGGRVARAPLHGLEAGAPHEVAFEGLLDDAHGVTQQGWDTGAHGLGYAIPSCFPASAGAGIAFSMRNQGPRGLCPSRRGSGFSAQVIQQEAKMVALLARA